MSAFLINDKTETQLNSIIFDISSRMINRESHRSDESFIYDELDYINNLIDFEAAIVCSVGRSNKQNAILAMINHSYPQRWISAYLSEGFLSIDPVIQVPNSSQCIVEWDKISKKNQSDGVNDFWNSASDEALSRGISIKCRKTLDANETIISLANVPAKNLNISKVILSTFAPIFDFVLNEKKRLQSKPLTHKEVEILKWFAEGKSVWEIGKILCISEGTVKFHTKNIFIKLDVNSRTLAVVKAMRNKIIN